MAKVVQNSKVFLQQHGVEYKPYLTAEQEKERRLVKEVGYGVKTPESAKEGNYVDNKCCFTGNVSIRGRIREAEIVSQKSVNTAIVSVHYLKYDHKYKRYARKNSRIACHLSPCFKDLEVGDTVLFGETRKLSKTKSHAIIGLVKKGNKQ